MKEEEIAGSLGQRPVQVFGVKTNEGGGSRFGRSDKILLYQDRLTTQHPGLSAIQMLRKKATGWRLFSMIDGPSRQRLILAGRKAGAIYIKPLRNNSLILHKILISSVRQETSS